MRLNVLGSGSEGNTYLVNCDGEILILDCGISLKEAKIALNFDLTNVVGCFVTHNHFDHSKYRKDYEGLGVPMLAPYDTDVARASAHMGGYYIQAFKNPHGDIESYGALIRHNNGETILYLTDLSFCRYTFKGCKINHFLVEVNYQKKYVDIDAPNFKHKIGGHCSLETCKGIIQANLTPSMKSVIAVHLGFGSTNPTEIVNEIKSIVPDNVFVDYARKGTKYEL